MAECIEVMKKAYAALSAGRAVVPLRVRLPVTPNDGLSIIMPAFVDDEAEQALVVKIVSLFDKNPSNGLPLIHAGALVLNPETGAVEALLEGGSLTAIRTGAGAGAATDVLARKDARTLAIFGAGVQAHTQLQAACEVRDIQSVWVYDPNQNQVKKFIEEMAGKGRVPKSVRAAHNSTEAVIDADIISTATTSNTPVFIDSDLKPGVHINGVGAYTLQMQEIPSETAARARVTVDSSTAAQVESGDIANPLNKGLIQDSEIAEIGEVISGTKPGRTSPDQITMFKSVGVAVQDAVAARLAVENARKLGLGTEVVW
jgi:ornithine cyclodeaminase